MALPPWTPWALAMSLSFPCRPWPPWLVRSVTPCARETRSSPSPTASTSPSPTSESGTRRRAETFDPEGRCSSQSLCASAHPPAHVVVAEDAEAAAAAASAHLQRARMQHRVALPKALRAALHERLRIRQSVCRAAVHMPVRDTPNTKLLDKLLF
jgi:hypothetical protein